MIADSTGKAAKKMQVISTVQDLLEARADWTAFRTVGLVPTMGYLHAGHLSLVRQARQEICRCLKLAGLIWFSHLLPLISIHPVSLRLLIPVILSLTQLRARADPVIFAVWRRLF
jgi:hypothetical protein